MLQSKTVEVMSVSRVTESATGKTIFLVQFGESVKATDELRKYLPNPPASMPPEAILVNVLILYFNSATVAPYKVGSKWRLDIEDNGAIKLNGV